MYWFQWGNEDPGVLLAVTGDRSRQVVVGVVLRFVSSTTAGKTSRAGSRIGSMAEVQHVQDPSLALANLAEAAALGDLARRDVVDIDQHLDAAKPEFIKRRATDEDRGTDSDATATVGWVRPVREVRRCRVERPKLTAAEELAGHGAADREGKGPPGPVLLLPARDDRLGMGQRRDEVVRYVEAPPMLWVGVCHEQHGSVGRNKPGEPDDAVTSLPHIERAYPQVLTPLGLPLDRWQALTGTTGAWIDGRPLAGIGAPDRSHPSPGSPARTAGRPRGTARSPASGETDSGGPRDPRPRAGRSPRRRDRADVPSACPRPSAPRHTGSWSTNSTPCRLAIRPSGGAEVQHDGQIVVSRDRRH